MTALLVVLAVWLAGSFPLAVLVGRVLARRSRLYPEPSGSGESVTTADGWAVILEDASAADLGWHEGNPAPAEAMTALYAALRKRAGRRDAEADDALAADLSGAFRARQAAEPAARTAAAAWQQREAAS